MKRRDYFSKEEFNFLTATLACGRSKDPNTRNGAVIIEPDTSHVLGVGYNGMPNKCDDDEFPWGNDSPDMLDTKYPYVVHAERNAIYNCEMKPKGGHLYLFSENGYSPCQYCTQSIIQNGISKIYLAYQTPEIGTNIQKQMTQASMKMLNASGVNVAVLGPNHFQRVLERGINHFAGLLEHLQTYCKQHQ